MYMIKNMFMNMKHNITCRYQTAHAQENKTLHAYEKQKYAHANETQAIAPYLLKKRICI